MDKTDIRSILSVYRAGEIPADDLRFEEAKKQAEADPDLARWWAEEQELDQLIGSKLQSTPVPGGLKSRLLETQPSAIPMRSTRARKITLLAAAIALLAVLFSSWRGPFQPAVSLADYRDEMVGFIKVTPALELKTNELSHITAFLEKTGAPSRWNLPQKLQEMEPIGCRTLRFHRRDVALVCFRRQDDRLVHLFVVNRTALPHLRSDRGAPQYQAQGDWMTAAWMEGDQAYLLTTQGDRALLEKYLSSS